MTRVSQPRVALIIPAYNEAGMITKVISGLKKIFQKQPYDCQIIVVDDGSRDDTAAQAERAGAYVIRHILNTGSGGATATGLSYAAQHGFDIAATVDADGQHAAADVLSGVKLSAGGHGDLLIGSRLLDHTGMSRAKVLGNTSLSLLTYLLFGIQVTDSQSGLRIFSRRALSALKWKTSGYEFCSEMLWRAKQAGLVINEFAAEAIYSDYSKGKGQNNWNAVNIIKALFFRRIMELFSE